MLKILWKRGKIAPEEQFLLLSTIFYYLMLDFYVKTGIRFSLRDKRLFEITEVEITRVDCMHILVTACLFPWTTYSFNNWIYTFAFWESKQMTLSLRADPIGLERVMK